MGTGKYSKKSSILSVSNKNKDIVHLWANAQSLGINDFIEAVLFSVITNKPVTVVLGDYYPSSTITTLAKIKEVYPNLIAVFKNTQTGTFEKPAKNIVFFNNAKRTCIEKYTHTDLIYISNTCRTIPTQKEEYISKATPLTTPQNILALLPKEEKNIKSSEITFIN